MAKNPNRETDSSVSWWAAPTCAVEGIGLQKLFPNKWVMQECDLGKLLAYVKLSNTDTLTRYSSVAKLQKTKDQRRLNEERTKFQGPIHALAFKHA